MTSVLSAHVVEGKNKATRATETDTKTARIGIFLRFFGFTASLIVSD
jgi:hypothetical protein